MLVEKYNDTQRIILDKRRSHGAAKRKTMPSSVVDEAT
jgi:hypothetical protein